MGEKKLASIKEREERRAKTPAQIREAHQRYAIFGVDLEFVMKRVSETGKVPFVLRKMLDWVLEHGLEVFFFPCSFLFHFFYFIFDFCFFVLFYSSKKIIHKKKQNKSLFNRKKESSDFQQQKRYQITGQKKSTLVIQLTNSFNPNQIPMLFVR